MERPSSMSYVAGRQASNVLGAASVRDEVLEGLTIVDPQLQEKYGQEESGAEEEISQDIVEPQSLGPPTPLTLREKLRVLFISYEREVFEEGSRTQALYIAYGASFEEVHVIVFTEASYTFSGLQIAENVWVYPTNTTS